MPTDKPFYIPIKNRPPSERPRERLWNLGADKLSTAELLAILIRKGTAGRSAIQVAEELIGSVNSLDKLRELTPSEIRYKIKGLGEANTASIVAALELGRRANHPPSLDKIYLRTVDDVADYFREKYLAKAPEKFVAFFINRNYLLLYEMEVSRGGSNAVVVDPQGIFKEALLVEAKAIILAHNHPGGDTIPSEYDISLTQELKKAGDLFRIPVVDHIVITGEDSISISERG